MGVIRQGGWSYTLTPADKLWAARMVEGEGPAEDAGAVLWTMTQLFTPAGQRKKYGRPDQYRSFAALIQAYSQPINPIWRHDGSKCRPGGSHAGTEACSEFRLQRRADLATLPYSAVDPTKRAIVERWAGGSLSNPVPGAIEFAAPSVSRSFLERRPGWRVISGGSNWFLVAPGQLERTTISGRSIGALLLLAGGGAAAWYGGRWLARRRSRAR